MRRKVLHLSKINLLDYTKTGISIGSEYKKVFSEFVSDTVNKMSQLVKKWESNGSLKKLLELDKNYEKLFFRFKKLYSFNNINFYCKKFFK